MDSLICERISNYNSVIAVGPTPMGSGVYSSNLGVNRPPRQDRTVTGYLAIAILLLFCSKVFSQDIEKDSVKLLDEVVIKSFNYNRPKEEIPSSIARIDSKELERFSNSSLLPAVNTVPGVRMEERSPGSYRFSIRGSLLRSPFGVRNVKFYWNGLPLTDGGGNTYLNLIDFNSVGDMEIIKGPGSSLYGAGTGGVALLQSPAIRKNQIGVSVLQGSYGLQRYQVGAQVSEKKLTARLQYAHQQFNGFREQTEMKRDALNADLSFIIDNKNSISATLFYSDLFYETPGGLTKTQYDDNPKQARPAGGPNRGAVEQKASVHNKTPYLGISYESELNDRWKTRAGLFGSHSDFSNPSIRNYEVREESNLGGRSETQYEFGTQQKGKLTFGGEYQYFKSPISIYGNDSGAIDTLQTKDNLTSRIALLFGQVEMELPLRFYLTVGASANFHRYGFDRTYPNIVSEERNLDPAFSPRIALLNRITPNISLYASVSRGFSPPGIAELYPSRQIFDKDIQAEYGTNAEVGVRGELLDQKLDFEITAYNFQLNKALVIRRDTLLAGDPEYFVNAGSTLQRGIESVISWAPLRDAKRFVSDFKIWNSYSLNHYRFREYIQDGNDLFGKKLTGVPPVVNSTGIDLVIQQKFYLNATINYVDHTPLSDANSVYASEYLLVGSRLGYKTNVMNNYGLEIFIGTDNALDKKYSLGNDLNAIGGRYYNAAPGRNYFAGLKFSIASNR